jgi:23S rRNA pseudouridine2605 synthase
MHDPRFRDRAPEAPPFRDGVRLERVLARAGLASRRACELAIRAGRVRVNGQRVVRLPHLVEPSRDVIELDGAVVETSGRAGARARLYFLLNKPRGVISTARDPEGRPNVVDLVRAAVPPHERVYPVGRLDADSTGLVLLTNDGDLAHRLAHPRHGVPKEYRVAVQGTLTDEALARLARGLFLGDPRAPDRGATRARLEQARVLKRTKDRRRGDLSLLSVTLREGRNREIRRLFARIGVKVRRLERVAIGPLRLGGLPSGHFRRLRADEVRALHHAVGIA